MKKSVILLVAVSILINVIAVMVLANNIGKNDPSKYPLLSKRLFAENKNDIIVNLAPFPCEQRLEFT